MCGRFTISKDKTEVVHFLNEHFYVDNVQDFNLPRYNIGPSQDLIALLFDGDKYRVGTLAWDYRIMNQGRLKQMINARAETVDQLYSFKKSFMLRRCLILTDGFYEWDQVSKQPYRILKKDGSLHFYAGIYHSYISSGEKHFGALIITTSANELIGSHHSRMPVMLDVKQAKSYLDPSQSVEDIKSLLNPYPSEKMWIYPINKAVNSLKNDGIELFDEL